MLEDAQMKGAGSTQMFIGKTRYDANGNDISATTTIDDLLANADLMKWSEEAQVEIDKNLVTLKDAIGLTDDEIIPIPTIFEEACEGSYCAKIAWTPGTVNSLIYGDTIMMPNPFGPTIDGADMFAKDLTDRLASPLNALGKENGIGRLDLVENRFVGMKSRGMYETPGGTILAVAHRGIESITLDRGAGHLKDELMPKYAELVYFGFWFSPEREMLQALIDKSQEYVAGTVRMKLYKGNTTVVGRSSPYSLYRQDYVTFEKDSVYNQKDAEGFIKLNALRLRLLAARNQSVK
jgi:hypothetical protein